MRQIQNVPEHDGNDRLTVFKDDGEIMEDENLCNELGVLVSQDLDLVIADPAMLVGLRRVLQPECPQV